MLQPSCKDHHWSHRATWGEALHFRQVTTQAARTQSLELADWDLAKIRDRRIVNDASRAKGWTSCCRALLCKVRFTFRINIPRVGPLLLKWHLLGSEAMQPGRSILLSQHAFTNGIPKCTLPSYQCKCNERLLFQNFVQLRFWADVKIQITSC